VTAAGYIVKVTAKSDPELYWALRGGGNNFGIVTAFTFEALPLPNGEMWGGTKTFLEPSFDDVSEAFSDLIENSPEDPNAGAWVAWLQNSGMKLAATELWYAKPDGDKAAIFHGFQNITAIADSTQNQVLHEYTEALDVSNPQGFREVYYGLTVKANADIAKAARKIFYEELPSTSSVAGANPVLIFQGITEGQIAHMSKNGGNPLGISPSDGPLYIIHVASWWQNSSDDATIYSFISKVLSRIKAESKKLDVASDYIYMNYASTFENVIAGYGKENVARLKKIAGEYDPTGVFQKLQPGGFKLDRAPTPDSRYFSGQ
jgi:FAD/FMN-containing dehydrogenase